MQKRRTLRSLEEEEDDEEAGKHTQTSRLCVFFFSMSCHVTRVARLSFMQEPAEKQLFKKYIYLPVS